MNKYEITKKIERFAPVDTAEAWDCSGWIVETSQKDVSKVMLALTPCDEVFYQAKNQNCDMIISHHPLFYVPFDFKDINIYCAHTNLDKTDGGTTDTVITSLGYDKYKINIEHEFLRMIELEQEISVKDFAEKLRKISPDLRYTDNKNCLGLKKIAFCSGSGSEFIKDAKNFGADCLVTGDLKFHTALESDIVVFDIGHFESEIIVLPVLEKLIQGGVKVVYAKEKSPFLY